MTSRNRLIRLNPWYYLAIIWYLRALLSYWLKCGCHPLPSKGDSFQCDLEKGWSPKLGSSGHLAIGAVSCHGSGRSTSKCKAAPTSNAAGDSEECAPTGLQIFVLGWDKLLGSQGSTKIHHRFLELDNVGTCEPSPFVYCRRFIEKLGRGRDDMIFDRLWMFPILRENCTPNTWTVSSNWPLLQRRH